MKIGISMEMVNLNTQEPNRNRRECKYYWDEIYTLVSAAGFDTIEIPYEFKQDFGGRSGIPLSMRSIAFKHENVENYVKRLNSSGINSLSSAHLDPSLFVSDNLPRYIGAFEHYAGEAVELVSQAGGGTVVLTVAPCIGDLKNVYPKESDFDKWTKQLLDSTAEMINRLAGTAANKKVTLCLKNEYWSPLRGEAIAAFLDGLAENVRLDADTANLQIAGVDPVKFIESNIKKIGIVHFTDTDFVDDGKYYEKRMPEFPAEQATQVFRDIGQGTVDFPAIYNVLKKSGYSGSVFFNCRQTRDVCRALLRTRYYINTFLS